MGTCQSEPLVILPYLATQVILNILECISFDPQIPNLKTLNTEPGNTYGQYETLVTQPGSQIPNYTVISYISCVEHDWNKLELEEDSALSYMSLKSHDKIYNIVC